MSALGDVAVAATLCQLAAHVPLLSGPAKDRPVTDAQLARTVAASVVYGLLEGRSGHSARVIGPDAAIAGLLDALAELHAMLAVGHLLAGDRDAKARRVIDAAAECARLLVGSEERVRYLLDGAAVRSRDRQRAEDRARAGQ